MDGNRWVRVDPTSVIPVSNVKNSLNSNFSNEDNNTSSIFTLKIFKTLGNYITYADFVWTKHLLSYDNNKRKSLIKDIMNLKFSNIFYWIFAPVLIFLMLKIFFKLNKSNILTWMLKYIIWTSKKETIILKSDTHQEVLKKLKFNYQKRYQPFFYLYESFRYQNQNIELTKIFRTFMSAK